MFLSLMKSLSIFIYIITYMYCVLVDTTNYRYIILICMSLLSRNIKYPLIVLVLILVVYNLFKDIKIVFVSTRYSVQRSVDEIVFIKYTQFYEAWEDFCVSVYHSARKFFN
jgi:hypothetical protein